MVDIGGQQHGVSLKAIFCLPCSQLGKVFAVVSNLLSLLQVGNAFRRPHKGGWVNFADVVALYHGTASVSATPLCVM